MEAERTEEGNLAQGSPEEGNPPADTLAEGTLAEGTRPSDTPLEDNLSSSKTRSTSRSIKLKDPRSTKPDNIRKVCSAITLRRRNSNGRLLLVVVTHLLKTNGSSIGEIKEEIFSMRKGSMSLSREKETKPGFRS